MLIESERQIALGILLHIMQYAFRESAFLPLSIRNKEEKSLPVHPPAQIKNLPRRLLPNPLYRTQLLQ